MQANKLKVRELERKINRIEGGNQTLKKATVDSIDHCNSLIKILICSPQALLEPEQWFCWSENTGKPVSFFGAQSQLPRYRYASAEKMHLGIANVLDRNFTT